MRFATRLCFLIVLGSSAVWAADSPDKVPPRTMSAEQTMAETGDPFLIDHAYDLTGAVSVDARRDGEVLVHVETPDTSKLFMFQLDGPWPFELEIKVGEARVFVRPTHGIVVVGEPGRRGFVFSVSEEMPEHNPFLHDADIAFEQVGCYGFVEYFGFEGGLGGDMQEIDPCTVGGFPCDAGGPQSSSCSISGCPGSPSGCGVSGCDGLYRACCGCTYGMEGRACCKCVPAGG